MKKQTSVDWLYDKLEHTRFPTVEELNEILQTAREMHRQEIEKAYYYGAIHSDPGKYIEMKKYYTETFQKPNNNQNG